MGDSSSFEPSSCHRGCGMLQVQSFDFQRDTPVCCGVGGYICGEDEGQCSTNDQCADGLYCKPNSCSWISNGRCCVPGDAEDEVYEFTTVSRRYVATATREAIIEYWAQFFTPF